MAMAASGESGSAEDGAKDGAKGGAKQVARAPIITQSAWGDSLFRKMAETDEVLARYAWLVDWFDYADRRRWFFLRWERRASSVVYAGLALAVVRLSWLAGVSDPAFVPWLFGWCAALSGWWSLSRWTFSRVDYWASVAEASLEQRQRMMSEVERRIVGCDNGLVRGWLESDGAKWWEIEKL